MHESGTSGTSHQLDSELGCGQHDMAIGTGTLAPKVNGHEILENNFEAEKISAGMLVVVWCAMHPERPMLPSASVRYPRQHSHLWVT